MQNGIVFRKGEYTRLINSQFQTATLVGDKMELSTILELLYTARNRFSSIQVTWQYLVKLDLMNDVHQISQEVFSFTPPPNTFVEVKI
jgi:hypothetical protein